MTAPAPTSAPDLARPALAWRLHDLSRQAEDAEVPIELGGVLGTICIAIALTLWLISLFGYFEGTEYTLGGPVPWWFRVDREGLLAVILVAGLLATTAGAVFALHQIRGIFRRSYLLVMSDLLTTTLPLVVADEAMRGLIRELHDSNVLRKWLRPAYSASLESQLLFASRYYHPLLSISRGKIPTAREVSRAEGCSPAPSWANYGLLIALLFVPIVHFGVFPVALIMFLFGTSEGLQQKARLAALCDFYLDRDSSPWLRGWACRRSAWPRLRGNQLQQPTQHNADIAPTSTAADPRAGREQILEK